MDKIISFVILALIVFLSFKADDLMDWAMNNTPWIVLGFLIFIGIFLFVMVIKDLISSYQQDPVKTKKYVIKNLKVLGFSLFVSLLILGVIILNVLENT